MGKKRGPERPKLEDQQGTNNTSSLLLATMPTTTTPVESFSKALAAAAVEDANAEASFSRNDRDENSLEEPAVTTFMTAEEN